ncbi:MAG: hypothetical protein K5751_00525 [Treponemataceae bacterium]|nr:hypothetical protein [Treponemataceae bacterium]
MTYDKSPKDVCQTFLTAAQRQQCLQRSVRSISASATTTAAYNITEDTDGKNPWVHNNSIAWLAGFVIDLPFWNANLNEQETGTFILHCDECDKNTADVDYAKHYSNNKIVCNFSTSFLNDKFLPQLTVMYGIERGDLAVMPLVEHKPDQNLKMIQGGCAVLLRKTSAPGYYRFRANRAPFVRPSAHMDARTYRLSYPYRS